MTTGHSDNTHGDTHLTVHADFPSSAAHGNIHWNTTTSNYYVYTDSTSADNTTGTWVYPDNTTVDIGTGSYRWTDIYIPGGSAGGSAIAVWMPQKCKCCDKDIKEKDDGLSIKMGDKEFWFHRRCFGNKRNSSFIRSLIISTDLGLLD